MDFVRASHGASSINGSGRFGCRKILDPDFGAEGFHFGDYWRMGLPRDLIVLSVSPPMLMCVWPL